MASFIDKLIGGGGEKKKDKQARAGVIESSVIVSDDALGEVEDLSEQAEIALPELEFRQLQRTHKPIDVDMAGKKLTIETILPWNNYTIVTLKGLNSIVIFDESGVKVDSFGLISSKTIHCDWALEGFRRKIGNFDNVGLNQDVTTKKIDSLPIELRAAARATLSGATSFRIWDKRGVDFNISKIIILGKYIFCISPENVFFAYQTENDSGVVLSPRNWKRIGPADVITDDLDKYIESFLAQNEGYKNLNDKFSAVITDVEVNLFEQGTAKGKPLFSDRLPSVKDNLIVDPTNSNIVYYCQSSNPRVILRLDLSGEPGTWSPVAAELPKQYESISNLQLDPSGNFFLFYSKSDLIIITKDGLEEVKRVPDLTHVNFDSTGNIRAVDKDGHLVIYQPGFAELQSAMAKQRVERLARGLEAVDIFDVEAKKKEFEQKDGGDFKYLETLKDKYKEQLEHKLQQVTSQDHVDKLRQGLNKLSGILKDQGLKVVEVAFVMAGLNSLIEEKEREFAVRVAFDAVALVRATLATGLSIASIADARAVINPILATEALLESGIRQEVKEVVAELEQKSLELFRQRGGEIVKDIHGLVERVKTDLEGFTSKAQMDDWLEFRYPQLKSKLGALLRDVPVEADDAYKAIIGARDQLQALAAEFEDKFKRAYAQVREKVAERTEAVVDNLTQDLESLVARLREKGFADRATAERYLNSSEAHKTLEAEIVGLAGANPDVAKELERLLKVKLSNALTEIERGAMTQVAGTGQQMVAFGATLFPKWEAKVKEKVKTKFELSFEEDAKTHGPGVKAGEILGDVAMVVTTSTGKDKIRLYEDWDNENEWRLGLLTYRGEAIPPSYLTVKEFREVRKAYAKWSQGESSMLRKQLEGIRQDLKASYVRYVEAKKSAPEQVAAIKKEYSNTLKEYALFVAENHISLLRRIDQIKAQPEVVHANGKGYVPEWQSHWVMDHQTEVDLEAMAKTLKMQLDLQEGLLNLKGHAGTGKDVRMKMFCALTHRPYFAIDGTKWITEFELSEDVMLEAKDGASQTLKVPSAVLNGIETPGAVVYFNEFNAMPEQAQIFLHALMDEKRSLTLKTSSGRTIRALPSVLLVGSMNPGYPGTFTPQFATRSRMVSLEIGYPPLTRKSDAGDTNPNLPYDASEALRIARGIDSLADLTYEASLERNDYVKMWDKYVNGIENGAADPTMTQKFDIDASLALIQFANKLREDFIKIFEGSREARNALPVSQPITGRELRRCAYALSKMTDAEKATSNPEAVVKMLLEKYFLSHIDKKEDRDKIQTAMNTWTSKKRVRA